jgi:hypothetical protein
MAGKPDSFNEAIIKLPELATVLGVSVDAVRYRIARGNAPKMFRLGRSLVTSRPFLIEYLKTNPDAIAA